MKRQSICHKIQSSTSGLHTSTDSIMALEHGSSIVLSLFKKSPLDSMMPTSTPNAHLQLLSSTTGSKWASTALLTNRQRHLPAQNESNCVLLSQKRFPFSFFLQSMHYRFQSKSIFDSLFLQSKLIPIFKFIEV